MTNKYNLGTVDPKKLSNFITGNLKLNNQAFGKDGKVYNNMESDYVADKNMLHDFESMLKQGDHKDQDLIDLINADNRDRETSKIVDSKEKSNTKETSSEKLDPAQEEFFAQLIIRLKLLPKKEQQGSDDEAVYHNNTSKIMQNKIRDFFADAFAKAYNPKNTQQTGGSLNELDKKMKLKAVIKKFAKKYKLNPKAIRKSLKPQIKQASKKNNLNGLTKSLKPQIKQASKKNKHSKVTQPFSVQGVNAVLNPRTTPPFISNNNKSKGL